MKKIIIIGSGGFAAEAYSYISQHENAEIGFIDDVDPNYAREDIKPKIIGKISDLDDSIISENLFFIGYGDPRKKQAIYNSIKELNLKYYSFIHPTSQVSTSAKLSDGCFLYPFTVIANNAKIGSHCIINSYSAIGHDSTLGNFSTLSAHVDITGNVNVGEVCFFGSGSRTLPNINIADDSRVGAGNVVLRNTSKSDILMPNVPKKIRPKK
jgi:sugar O-acyltransferase (sialic acid O-acetyltransferase NeuD family)